MKVLSISPLLLLLCSPILVQGATTPEPPQVGTTQSQSEMPAGIDVALKKYISAYEQRNMQNLLAVWPDLETDKKEFGSIKKHFDDGSVSNEHMSLHPLETKSMNNEAVVKCERTEKFAKAETLESGGDLMMNRSPAQNPGNRESTKTVKKTDKVWMKLHKQNDDWVITAVSSKELSL